MRSISGSAESDIRLLLARDAGARYQIDETARILRHQLQPPLRAGGRGKKHGIESRLAHHLHVIARFFHAGVCQQAAVDTRGLWRPAPACRSRSAAPDSDT